jgi:hypothetical protein
MRPLFKKKEKEVQPSPADAMAVVEKANALITILNYYQPARGINETERNVIAEAMQMALDMRRQGERYL